MAKVQEGEKRHGLIAMRTQEKLRPQISLPSPILSHFHSHIGPFSFFFGPYNLLVELWFHKTLTWTASKSEISPPSFYPHFPPLFSNLVFETLCDLNNGQQAFVERSLSWPPVFFSTNDIQPIIKMGIIRSAFSFIAGTVFGVYVAQNYNVPNVRKITNTGLLIANHIEETYRKPKKRDGDD
ncbi:hypothetical protein Peur_003234 [Populus x canadensis]